MRLAIQFTRNGEAWPGTLNRLAAWVRGRIINKSAAAEYAEAKVHALANENELVRVLDLGEAALVVEVDFAEQPRIGRLQEWINAELLAV